MNYPLISEYVSSVLYAEDNLATKTSLRPVLDSTGNPVMSSGNFAVVFKMIDINENKHFAMKCFLRDQIGREDSYLRICEELEFVESSYLLKTEYLPGELFVDTNQCDETEYPVLLMEWVEGCTLGAFISDNYTDSFRISQVAYNFSKMASWLLSQDFAHGDIKPDNIIVKDNGNLVLVDYDGMYVPSMKGSVARENGSPNFRHPGRTNKDFDEHIDDFALAALNLTLKVLSLNFDAFSTIVANDYCIFSESDYRDIYNAEGLYYIESQLKNSELQKLWGVFLIALSEKKLSSVSFRLTSLALPPKDGNYSKLTERTDEENERLKEDGFVVDRSGKRLITANVPGEDLMIPEGIELICGQALQSKNYKSIVLPDSVRAIGGIAFANIEELERINIPKGVVFIEHNNPIGGCINLRDIRVDSPNYVIENDCLYSSDHQILYASLFSGNEVVEVHPDTTMIAGNAFWQRNVESIILPQGLSVISGSGAFGYCNKIKEITIPDSVVEIGNCSFGWCKSLERISIPDSVMKLGSRVQKERPRGMFQGCESLKFVTLPTKIEFIGESFFRGCSSLNQVTLPNSIVEIGACAFEGCSSLEEITIPSSVKIIRDNVFRLCSSLKSIYIPDSVVVFGDKDPDSIASKPTSRMGILKSIGIGSGMFSSCSSLEYCRLPKCMTKLDISIFKNCKSLRQVDLPDTITEIKYEAFANCRSLILDCLPAQLQIIHSQAFASCSSMSSIRIPDGVSYLRERAFENCVGLRHVNLPSSLNHLEGNPFTGCFDLDISVDSDAFIVENNSLYSFDKSTLHSYLGGTKIDDSVFIGVSRIDRYCFSKSRIESVIIPCTIKSIDDWAFFECSSLKKVVLNGISELSRCLFYSCQSLEEISIPTTVTHIKESAFWGCKSLKKVELPDSIETIGDAAFDGCESLKTIVLPESVKEITRESSKRGLFRDCKNLSTIHINSYLPSLQEFDFQGCESLTRIYVPYMDIAKYRNTLGKYFSLVRSDADDLPF